MRAALLVQVLAWINSDAPRQLGNVGWLTRVHEYMHLVLVNRKGVSYIVRTIAPAEPFRVYHVRVPICMTGLRALAAAVNEHIRRIVAFVTYVLLQGNGNERQREVNGQSSSQNIQQAHQPQASICSLERQKGTKKTQQNIAITSPATRTVASQQNMALLS